MPRRSVPLLSLLLASCVAVPPNAGPQVRIAHRPPDRTDILEALILSEAVSLAADTDCDWDPQEKDRTLGRYLAGLLTGPYEISTDEPGVNWIEIATLPETGRERSLWRSRVLIHAGEREALGLEFLIRRSDGLVLADTFRCVRAE